MTVHRLRTEMSSDEFVRWTRFFAVRQQSQELQNMQATSRMQGR